jgi:hypothetical protein
MRKKNNSWLNKYSRRWLNVYEELVGHAFAMALVLISFWMIEALYNLLWGSERLLFGFLPFHWVIDAADFFAFLAFSYAGIISSIRAFRGEQ